MKKKSMWLNLEGVTLYKKSGKPKRKKVKSSRQNAQVSLKKKIVNMPEKSLKPQKKSLKTSKSRKNSKKTQIRAVNSAISNPNYFTAQGYKIKKISGDGNCLFRAISHQVYGNEHHHRILRARCCTYMLQESNFFKSFINEDS